MNIRSITFRNFNMRNITGNVLNSFNIFLVPRKKGFCVCDSKIIHRLDMLESLFCCANLVFFPYPIITYFHPFSTI